MTFVKAVVEEVTAGPDAPQRVGKPFTVQLNPASVRLQMASTVDFGKDTGRQKIQYQGSTSTLSFDLVFDTADEGTTDAPVDVRSRTRQLERFVLPKRNEAKSVPPRLRFTYGTFSVIGVMTALNQDFDLFAANGVPLRAKCAVTIKEQRPEFDAALVGAGANTGAGATPPVAPGLPGAAAAARGGGAPGTGTGPGNGTGGGGAAAPPDRSATAVAGESAADFAARMGLDPRAWKTMLGIDDPLRLTAGQQVDFSTAPTSAPGLGAEQAAPAAPGAALTPAGVTAAGGLVRALDDEQARAAATAAQAAAAAFDRPSSTTSAAPGPALAAGSGSSGSAPTAPSSASSASGSSESSPASPLPVDARARTYGFGVPLRPRPGPVRAGTGLVRPRASASPADGGPWTTTDPTVPRWRTLPAGPAGTGPSGCRCAGPASTCGCRP